MSAARDIGECVERPDQCPRRPSERADTIWNSRRTPSDSSRLGVIVGKRWLAASGSADGGHPAGVKTRYR
jgi:hypothetical protein